MRTKKGWELLALTAAVLLAACADPTSPAHSLTGDVSATVNPFVPANPFPNSLDWGEVRVCKTVPAGDPAQTFNFTATVTPVLPAGAALSPINFSIDAVPGQTICTDIFDSSKSGIGYDQLVIVESAVTNWANTDINVDRYRAIAYAPPAGFTDSEDETTRTATVYVNSDEGRVVTFTNDYTAPPPPPAICDFITFGRLVTSIGGKKVVISGNAGGNNADGSIKNEFHIDYLDVDYHVADAITYGPIGSGPLSLLTNSRVVTGVAKNGVAVELRLWDGGEPGKGTDIVWFSLNGSVKTAAAGQFIDQGNMQYHANCRGPGN